MSQPILPVTTTYVTFGSQYSLPGDPEGVPHPSGLPVSADGWCEITGPIDAETARQITMALFDTAFCATYHAEYFNAQPQRDQWYPLGCQLRVTVEAVTP